MSYRALVVTSGSPAFLDHIYQHRSEIAALPYARQLDELLFESFGWGDAYSLEFRKLGHEADTLLVNAESLQVRWAEEHGMAAVARELGWLHRSLRLGKVTRPLNSLVQARRRRLLGDIFLAQVEEYRPDVLLVQLQTSLPSNTIIAARAYTKVVVAQLASRFPAYADLFGVYDLIVSAFPQYVRLFNESGLRSEYLPQAFQPTFLERCRTRYGDVEGPEYDAVFAGSVSDQHLGRLQWLNELAATGRVEIFLSTDGLRYTPSLPEPLRSRHHSPVYGLAMYDVYRRARIALNAHPEISGPYATIMRMFEIAGSGTMLLTDDRPNMPEFFLPGVEAVTFEDVNDCVDKINYYLGHDAEREEIASKGRQRTLAEHTFEQRILELLRFVEPLL